VHPRPRFLALPCLQDQVALLARAVTGYLNVKLFQCVVLTIHLLSCLQVIHQLYVRQDFAECLNQIEEVLKETKGQSEYPIYVKGSFAFVLFLISSIQI
jgi:hypothetical protein